MNFKTVFLGGECRLRGSRNQGLTFQENFKNLLSGELETTRKSILGSASGRLLAFGLSTLLHELRLLQTDRRREPTGYLLPSEKTTNPQSC